MCSYLPCVYYNFDFPTAVLFSGNACLQAMVTDAAQTACFTDSQNAVNGNSLECWSSVPSKMSAIAQYQAPEKTLESFLQEK